MKYTGTIYIPIFDGIKEDIGSLEVNKAHIDELCDLHMDILVLDLTKLELIDEDIGRVKCLTFSRVVHIQHIR